jgi:Ca2+-binding RTX toxin-like protein
VARKTLAVVLGCVAAIGMAWPSTGAANHVSIDAAVGARLVERSGDRSWTVEVSWTVHCRGAQGSASYSGYLDLVDVDTGKRAYLGGVSSASGRITRPVDRKDHDYYVRPVLTINCWENASVHGSGTIAEGSPVLIPGRDSNGEGGSGGGGGDGSTGGGGDGSSGGDPSEPLESGGCVKVLWGTSGPDELAGGAAGDLAFGLQGADRLRGEAGDDCLIGGSDDDRLFGGAGADRLTGGRGDDRLDGERGNDRLDGGKGRDKLYGRVGRDKLYGGPSGDKLYGGSGKNSYNAGSGNDYVSARNGRRELVRCGSGRDRARVDEDDRVKSCERVSS